MPPLPIRVPPSHAKAPEATGVDPTDAAIATATAASAAAGSAAARGGRNGRKGPPPRQLARGVRRPKVEEQATAELEAAAAAAEGSITSRIDAALANAQARALAAPKEGPAPAASRPPSARARVAPTADGRTATDLRSHQRKRDKARVVVV